MLSADRIFFPTPRFVKIFEAAGKSTFPNGFTYKVRKSRVVEEVLFQFLGCPHPRTRIYFGRQKQSIPDHFSFPFLAMGASKSDAAHRVNSVRKLEELAGRFNPLVIQENLEYENRFRIVYIDYQFLGFDAGPASKSSLPPFRGGGESHRKPSEAPRLSKGSRGDSGGGSEKVIREAAVIVKSAGLNDIAVDVGIGKSGWFIIEFGRPPVLCSTSDGMINRFEYVSRLIES
jgi:hypothetical protein